MEKRRTKRITVSMKAERISGNLKKAVMIENISESGINMITAPAKTAARFKPGIDVRLKFRLSNGEILNLNCKVRWSYTKVPTDGLTSNVGLEIIDPPKEYRKFVKTLN
ncbi:MAG: PilZ domain-containing protein [Thermodesulfovibrionales bacterium]